MKNIKYIPIIKTGDAEIRGVENLSNNRFSSNKVG
jgi:hypothetical protein